MIGGTYGKGWDLQWDDLPFEHNVMYKVRQTFLNGHDEGTKGVRFNKKYQAHIVTEEKEDKNKMIRYMFVPTING